MTVSFELDGQRFVALNGGPAHPFTEAVSFAGRLHDAGGGRQVLGRAHRGRRGGPVRLAATTGSACHGRSSPASPLVVYEPVEVFSAAAVEREP